MNGKTKYSNKLVIGLMSGTSLDGIDAALVNISEKDKELRIEVVNFVNILYTDDFRQQLFDLVEAEKFSKKVISKKNIEIAEKFSEAVFKLLNETDLEINEIDLIGSHGQTVYHNTGNFNFALTLQLGAGAVIAEKTGITTIYNFRIRDVAASGEGAPLVPYVDYLLFKDNNKNRVMQNIGGIGNYTYLPAGGKLEDVLGSDTGPGNMMIDQAVYILSKGKYKFDKDGIRAAEGIVSSRLVDFMFEHPFFTRPTPKSTGRKDFGKSFVEKVINQGKKYNLKDDDIIASITAFTALSAVRSYKKFLPDKVDEIIISGGGSYNPVLMNMIRKYSREIISPEIKVLTLDEFGFSSEAKEAVAFAVLAYQTMKGRKNNIPTATGADHKVVLGDIVPGDNFFEKFNW